MSIPCKMRPAGLDSLPMGYTRLEFLESTGTQRIILDYVPTNDSGYYLRAANTNNSKTHLMSSCETGTDGGTYGVMPLWRTYTSTCSYMWGVKKDPAPQRKTLLECVSQLNWRGAKIRRISYKEDSTLDISGLIAWSGITYKFPEEYTPSVPFQLFYNLYYNAYAPGRIFELQISEGKNVVRHYIPVLDSTGAPCMFDIVNKKPFYNAATGSDFTAGTTLDQALKLKDLPAKIATLNVSLPEGYESNEDVMESIRQAEEKGWTINRTTYTHS